MRLLYVTRERFLDRFCDDEYRAFVKGTVFGDKSDISEEVMEDFSGNGTGHILAVSGLHTGFLYALLRFVTGRRRNIATAVLIISVLIVYGDMTLWSPSTMRAVTVLSVSIMAVYLKRPFDLLSSVSAAAVIILVREPYQLFSTGFQMSFLALLGIAFLSEPLSHFTGEALAVMLSVQAGILPVSAFVFHRINVLSIFINVPVIFLASLMVPLCMSALFAYTITGALPGIIITLIEGLSGVIIRLNGFMSAGGVFSNMATSAGAGVIVLFYLLVFMLASEWCRVRVLRHEYWAVLSALVCILAVSGCMGLAANNRFADDEIVFVSVGQGDCTHIRAGGKDVLIDGGGTVERNTGKDILLPYLLANGAERAEFALVTHLHTDHYLGIAELCQIYPVGAVGIPSDYRKSVELRLREKLSDNAGNTLAKSANTSGQITEPKNPKADLNDPLSMLPDCIEFIGPGSRISITDEVYIEPVWPVMEVSGGIEIDDANEHNMVYMIHYRGIRIMVTGDLLEEDELKMVDYYRGTDTLRCDILKVAHHGSKSSSCEAFLDAVSPTIAVIQVGRYNFYGHPHQQTLDRLNERGIEVYRTDLNGAVGIDIRGNRIRAEAMRPYAN